MIKRINYNQLPQITGPYVHAVKHEKTLYISGLTAFGTDKQSSAVAEQAQAILQQITCILETEKLDRSNLIKLIIFVTDIAVLGEIRGILFDFFGEHLPACSLVEVSRLIHSDLVIEIEAMIATS